MNILNSDYDDSILSEELENKNKSVTLYSHISSKANDHEKVESKSKIEDSNHYDDQMSGIDEQIDEGISQPTPVKPTSAYQDEDVDDHVGDESDYSHDSKIKSSMPDVSPEKPSQIQDEISDYSDFADDPSPQRKYFELYSTKSTLN